jgi:hypothetical protein
MASPPRSSLLLNCSNRVSGDSFEETAADLFIAASGSALAAVAEVFPFLGVVVALVAAFVLGGAFLLGGIFQYNLGSTQVVARSNEAVQQDQTVHFHDS